MARVLSWRGKRQAANSKQRDLAEQIRLTASRWQGHFFEVYEKSKTVNFDATPTTYTSTGASTHSERTGTSASPTANASPDKQSGHTRYGAGASNAMTGRELWERYREYTRDVTEHGRKLGFAGAAICWLFKRDDFTFPAWIYAALFFFVAYFIADIFQAFAGALMIKFFTEYHEARLWEATNSIEGDIPKPRWIDWPAFAFFLLKSILLIFGFAFIGIYLIARLV